MPKPLFPQVFIDFGAGWVDVTSDVDWNVGWSIRVGRTTPYSDIAPSSMTVTLHNPTGKYSPGVATLTDGTAAPHPTMNVSLPIRATIDGGVRFAGEISALTPVVVNGRILAVQVTALDLLDRLARITLAGQYRRTYDWFGYPDHYWPMDESPGSTLALDGGFSARDIPLQIGGTPGASGLIAFGGQTLPNSGDRGGVTLSPSSPTNSQELYGHGFPDVDGYDWAFEVVYNPTLPVSGVDQGLCTIALTTNETYFVYLHNEGFGTFAVYVQTGVAGPSVNVQVSGSYTPGTEFETAIKATLFMDSGVLKYFDLANGVTTVCTSSLTGPGQAIVGFVVLGAPGLNLPGYGTFAHAALWSTPNMVNDQGENSRQRAVINNNILYDVDDPGTGSWDVAKGYGQIGGVADPVTLDSDLDDYQQIFFRNPDTGKTLTGSMQDLARSESGGSAFYVLGGVLRFCSRRFRSRQTVPVMTIDMQADADGRTFQPSRDRGTLINTVEVTRTTQVGLVSSSTTTNKPSIIANHGRFAGQSVDTNLADPAQGRLVGQWIVAANGFASTRLPQLAVDLLTSPTDHYADLQDVEINSRLRATGLQPGVFPSTQLDVHVEGWTENASISQYQVVFDVSPADVPAPLIWSDTGGYGRWQPEAGAAKLTGGVTAAATSVSILTTGPPFTQNPAAYPLEVQVDGEVIVLPSAPASATSPQSWTGVTRGAEGTTPGAHATLAVVFLWPASTWAL